MHLFSDQFRMHHETAFSVANLTFIGANTVLGFITLSEVNIAIAAVGAIVTILANADRVAYSIVRVLELKRNNWRLPDNQDNAQNNEQQ